MQTAVGNWSSLVTLEEVLSLEMQRPNAAMLVSLAAYDGSLHPGISVEEMCHISDDVALLYCAIYEAKKLHWQLTHPLFNAAEQFVINSVQDKNVQELQDWRIVQTPDILLYREALDESLEVVFDKATLLKRRLAQLNREVQFEYGKHSYQSTYMINANDITVYSRMRYHFAEIPTLSEPMQGHVAELKKVVWKT